MRAATMKRTLEELQRELVGKRQERQFVVTREQLVLDEGNRTVEISFSSEFPVERWFGFEILDHAPGSVRLQRLNTSGPYLVNHDTDQKIGWVMPDTARVDADRKGRCTVRYSRRQAAFDEWQDVLDGAPITISVGYMIHKLVLEESSDDVDTYRATDWEPLEVSAARVPADITVGGGRELYGYGSSGGRDGEGDAAETCPDCELPLADCACERGKTTGADEGRSEENPTIEVRSNVMEPNEQQQSATLRATFEQEGEFFRSIVPDAPAMARAFFAEGKTVADFRAAVLEKQRAAQSQTPTPGAPVVDLTEREKKEYSISRAILTQSDLMRGERVNSFEMEVSEEIRKKIGHNLKLRGGVLVPTGVAMRGVQMQRTSLTSGGSATGSKLVFTEAGSFIELLRNQAKVIMLGATMLPGLQGNVAFPRQSAAGSTSWVGENPGADVAESNLQIDQVTLTPKTLMSRQSYSRQLLAQGVVNVDGLVTQDIATNNALELDRVSIHGSGSSNQPTGLYSMSGVNPVAFGGSVTFAKLVDMETAITTANADIGVMAYLTTPGVKGKAKQTQEFSGTNGVAVWHGAEMNGYRAEASNQVSSTLGAGTNEHGILFGVWSELLIGEWGAMELLPDPFTLAAQGLIRVISFLMADINARHAAAFAKGTGLVP